MVLGTQGWEHFGTFKRVWQHSELYRLWGESHAPDNMSVNVVLDRPLLLLLEEIYVQSQSSRERKVTSTHSTSFSTLVLNINSSVSMLNTLLHQVGLCRAYFNSLPQQRAFSGMSRFGRKGTLYSPQDKSFIQWLTSLWGSDSEGMLTCQSWFVSNVNRATKVPWLELPVIREIARKGNGREI